MLALGRAGSLVADGPLESNALLALEESLRVDLRLDRLEPREAVRAPDALLQRDALLLLLGERERYRTKRGVVGLGAWDSQAIKLVRRWSLGVSRYR